MVKIQGQHCLLHCSILTVKKNGVRVGGGGVKRGLVGVGVKIFFFFKKQGPIGDDGL